MRLLRPLCTLLALCCLLPGHASAQLFKPAALVSFVDRQEDFQDWLKRCRVLAPKAVPAMQRTFEQWHTTNAPAIEALRQIAIKRLMVRKGLSAADAQAQLRAAGAQFAQDSQAVRHALMAAQPEIGKQLCQTAFAKTLASTGLNFVQLLALVKQADAAQPARAEPVRPASAKPANPGMLLAKDGAYTCFEEQDAIELADQPEGEARGRLQKNKALAGLCTMGSKTPAQVALHAVKKTTPHGHPYYCFKRNEIDERAECTTPEQILPVDQALAERSGEYQAAFQNNETITANCEDGGSITLFAPENKAEPYAGELFLFGQVFILPPLSRTLSLAQAASVLCQAAGAKIDLSKAL